MCIYFVLCSLNRIFATSLRNLRNKHKLHDMNKIENPFLVYGYEGPIYLVSM